MKKKIYIMTSNMNIAIAALCLGNVAFILQLVLYSFGSSFLYFWLCIGCWGGTSVALIELEKAHHPDLPKYKTIGNLTFLLSIPSLAILSLLSILI